MRADSLFQYAMSPGWGSRSDLQSNIAAVAVLGTVAVAVVTIAFLRHRARLQEKRFELIRDLAEKGLASPQLIDRELAPKGKAAIMVFAWFLLIGGSGMLIAALAQDWPDDHHEFGAPGVGMVAFALATLSAPIMLRELRKQGVL